MSKEKSQVPSQHGLTHQTVKGFAWSGTAIVVQALLQIFVLAVLARLLSPHDFGVVGMAMIFVNFVERVGFLGIGPALVQRKEVSKETVSTAFNLCFLLGSFICVAFLMLSPFIGQFFREPTLVNVLRALSVTFLLESLGTVSENMLQRELRFKKLLFINSTSYFIGNACIGVLMAYYGYGVWALVAATVSTRVLKVSLLLLISRPKLTLGLRGKETRDLLRMGIGFSLGRLISFAALTGDNFVVGRLLGATALGMYGRAYQLMTLPATYFGQLLEKVMFPAMAKKQSDRKQLSQVFLWSIESSALVGIPTSVFMWITAEEIITVLFGKQWLSVAPTLKVLATGMFFRLCYKNSDTLIRSMGAVYKHAARQLVYAGVVIVGSSIGCFYGLEYVGAAVSVAVFLNYIILSELGLKLLGVSWKDFFKAHLSAIWVSILVFLAATVSMNYLRANDYPPLVCLLIAAGACGAAAVLALKISPKNIRPLVFDWALKTFKFEKLGGAGKSLRWVLS